MEESVIPPDNTFHYTVRIITTRPLIFGIYISCHISLQRYQYSRSLRSILYVYHTAVYAGGALHCLIVAGHTGSETVDDVGQNLLLYGRKNLFKQSIDCFFDQLFYKIDS